MENNLQCSFPVNVYGKRTRTDSAPEGYHWIILNKDITQRSLEILDVFVGSFQWLSGPDGQIYPPVASWLPEAPDGSSGFFVLFRDVGEDSGGRPHTVRAYCAYLSKEVLKELPLLPCLLLAALNQAAIENEDSECPRLVFPANVDGRVVAKFFSANHPVVVSPEPIIFRIKIPPKTIFLSGDSFKPIRYERSLSPHVNSERSHSMSPTESVVAGDRQLNRDMRRKRPMLWPLFFIIALCLLGGSLFKVYTLTQELKNIQLQENATKEMQIQTERYSQILEIIRENEDIISRTIALREKGDNDPLQRLLNVLPDSHYE